MQILITSIYDRISGLYGTPTFSVNEQTAIREYNYLLSNAKMVASDCDLYKLGTFDTITGSISSLDKPEFICHYEVGHEE